MSAVIAAICVERAGHGTSNEKGDLVHVRPAKEILATLDDRGELDGLPFMPEMVDQCGRTFRVLARADRVCDTISGQARSMRIADAVFLDDLRCDGSGHQTCQAVCRIYWKEAWLRPATAGPPRVQGDDPDRDALVALGGCQRPRAGRRR